MGNMISVVNRVTMGNKISVVRPDWGGLPHNIVDGILSKVESTIDYIRFKSVCMKWRSVWEFYNAKRNAVSLHHQPPMLMVPARARIAENAWVIFDMASNKIFGRWICMGREHGYHSNGWQLNIGHSGSASLHKPFSRNIKSTDHPYGRREINLTNKRGKRKDVLLILLPMLSLENITIDDKFVIRNTLISGDPAADDRKECFVVLTGEWGLAYLDIGSSSSSWTYLKGSTFEGLVDTVILGGNRVFAIKSDGSMISFKIYNGMTTVSVEEVAPPIHSSEISCHRYIVKSPSSDDLLQIERCVEFEITKSFRIFRFGGKHRGWVRVTRLEDMCLFVGDGSSISIKCSSFAGYESNCVYYAHHTREDFHWKNLDSGIYDLGTDEFERNSPVVLGTDDFEKQGPPFWLVPII